MLVALHVHRYPGHRVPGATVALRRDTAALAREPGLLDARWLVHGGGDHVGMRPAPTRQSVLTCWRDEAALAAAERREHPALRPSAATSTWTVLLDPVRTRGTHGDAVRDGGGSDFAEFLAARFVPLASRGDLDGVDPLAGRLAQPA